MNFIRLNDIDFTDSDKLVEVKFKMFKPYEI